MEAGQYTPEHAHDTESIIYTVTGEWVLCRAGHRVHMKPGSLFHFRRFTPTGYKVPFEKPAYILIFKPGGPGMGNEEFLAYLRRLKVDLEKRHREGMPFFLRELDPKHPARVFARMINPAWEARLADAVPGAPPPAR